MTTVLWLLAMVGLQEPPVFRTQVELVYVDVLVTSDGAPVAGLEASEFELEDNGIAQEVELVDRDRDPTTAVLVLDTSASVAGKKLAHLKEAARAFLAALEEEDEAGLVTFNHELALRADAGRDRAALGRALGRVEAGGGTSLIDALYVCLKRRWGTGRLLVVLFTDGQDSASWLENEDVLTAARESAATLHVVGTESLPERSRPLQVLLFQGLSTPVGAPDQAESGYVYLLRRAAETTGGSYWAAPASADLPAIFLEILEGAKARYVLRYEPTGVRREGRHRLKVSVQRRGVDVRARKEYVVRGDRPE